MACFAMACRRLAPCEHARDCEHHWHLCLPPEQDKTSLHWICPTCHVRWTKYQGEWHRD